MNRVEYFDGSNSRSMRWARFECDDDGASGDKDEGGGKIDDFL